MSSQEMGPYLFPIGQDTGVSVVSQGAVYLVWRQGMRQLQDSLLLHQIGHLVVFGGLKVHLLCVQKMSELLLLDKLKM